MTDLPFGCIDYSLFHGPFAIINNGVKVGEGVPTPGHIDRVYTGISDLRNGWAKWKGRTGNMEPAAVRVGDQFYIMPLSVALLYATGLVIAPMADGVYVASDTDLAPELMVKCGSVDDAVGYIGKVAEDSERIGKSRWGDYLERTTLDGGFAECEFCGKIGWSDIEAIEELDFCPECQDENGQSACGSVCGKCLENPTLFRPDEHYGYVYIGGNTSPEKKVEREEWLI